MMPTDSHSSLDTPPGSAPWQTLEDTHTALVQCRLHTAGGLELRHMAVTDKTLGYFVSLTPLAVERLRLALGIAPTHDTEQPRVLQPAGARDLDEMALILLACGYTVLAPGQAQGQAACETPIPLDTAPHTNGPQAPHESILEAAAAYFHGRHGHYWSSETRLACERELTARGWVHRLGYDEHKVELARDQELAQWFPPVGEE